MTTDRRGDNNGRREMDNNDHDKFCDRRITWMKTAIFLIISTVVIGGGFGYTGNENMKQINATQDVEIQHIEKSVETLERKFDSHLAEQRDVNKEMLEILNQLKTDVIVIKKGVQ